MDWNHMETHVHAGADIESVYSYDIAQQDITYRKIMSNCHNYALIWFSTYMYSLFFLFFVQDIMDADSITLRTNIPVTYTER